ncbi:MAG: hypothetical protein ACYDHN_00430 [Solirubrobacteraceae bacterium]
MRKRLTYANVTATLALVFSMSGGALAASHYLIRSTKQISPKVLRSFAASETALFKRLEITASVAKANVASTANMAGIAATANNATNATNATNAANATTAGTANALNGVKIVRGSVQNNEPESQGIQLVVCPSGLHAIAGGIEDTGKTEQSVNEWYITSSAAGADTAVKGFVNNTSTAAEPAKDQFNVFAVCAPAAVSG